MQACGPGSLQDRRGSGKPLCRLAGYPAAWLGGQQGFRRGWHSDQWLAGWLAFRVQGLLARPSIDPCPCGLRRQQLGSLEGRSTRLTGCRLGSRHVGGQAAIRKRRPTGRPVS